MFSNDQPRGIMVTVALVYGNALLWILLGSGYLISGWQQLQAQTGLSLFLLLAMYANAVGLLIIGYGLGRRRRRAYMAGLLLILANFVLSITDQIGFVDLVTLILNGFILVALVTYRSHYLSTF